MAYARDVQSSDPAVTVMITPPKNGNSEDFESFTDLSISNTY